MITGFRRYELLPRDGLLRGATAIAWKERELQAECNNTQGSKKTKQAAAEYHLKAEENICGCGIYITKAEYFGGYEQFSVLAAVTGWGAYIEFQNGWRVQYASIEHLWVTGAADIAALEKKYGVGVDVKTKVPAYAADPRAVTFTSTGGSAIGLTYVPQSYKVLAQACDRCNGTHDLTPWTPRDKKPLRVCEMDTSHISNTKRYLENLNKISSFASPPSAPWHTKWIAIFDAELKNRPALPTVSNGKVTW